MWHPSDRAKRVAPSGIRIIFEKAQRIKDVIRLEMGEPDFDTPDHIKEAVKKALDEGYTHYTSSAGIKDLREAIAKKLREENKLDVGSEGVIVTTGGCGAINLAFMVTLNPGDEVLVPDPGWPIYKECIKLLDGKVVPYSLHEREGFKVSLEELTDRITDKTKMMIISSPGNPTGCFCSRRELESIADILLPHNVTVLSDEVYEKIIYGDEHFSIASIPEMRDLTITVNSFSKTYAMTGMRIGYAAAKKEIIDEMAKLNIYLVGCVNAAVQRAAITALEGPQDCIGEMVREYKRRRDLVVKRLNSIDGIFCVEPRGAFYVFPNISSYGLSSDEFSLALLEQARISTTPGSGFGDLGKGHIRISYAKSIEELEEAMDRIERASHSL